MSFHEVRFPPSLSFGSVGGPERRTEVVTLANGFEERNTPWAHSRRRYDAGLGMRSLDDIEALVDTILARKRPGEIKFQKKAVAAAGEDSPMYRSLKASLDSYTEEAGDI